MSDFLKDLFSLEGKTALITGATGGLGEAFAQALARAGATVGVHGRDTVKTGGLCRAIEESGGNAFPFLADLREVAACETLIRQAQVTLGRLDILVNCAGMNRRKPIAEVGEDDYDTVLAVNLRSVFFLSKAAHQIMRDQGGGKIINIGSMNSVYGVDTVSIYGASKAGLAQITRVMAVEWARDNIQVNCLQPGFIKTPLTEHALLGNQQRRTWLHQRIPERRFGQPDELIGALLLLASPASAYMTGSTITVDGGFLAGGSWELDPLAE